MPEQSYSFTIAIPPLVTRIAKMLLTHNAKAYLVGGVVRDAVINETYKTNLELRDFDLEIFGLESKNVELLLKDNLPYYVSTEGKSFQVFKIHYQKGFKPIDIAIARSETSTGPSHTDFVVSADPSLSITQAARRRDLTMNALYYDIVKKRIIDPFYGFAHIQNKVIHHVNDDSFPEDPLRVLRVMQFASRFDFDVSDETIAVCKKIVESCSLSTLPPERVLAEFLTFLYESTTPSRGLDFLNKCDALSLFLPEIAHLVAIPQTPSWHPEGNVYKHTLQAANVAAQIASREGLSRFEKALLIMASLCHDLGKAETTRYNAEQDVYTAYTHSKEGEQLSKTLLNRLQLPAFIKDRVPVLTQKHLLLPVLYENHVNGIDQKRAVHRIMKQLAKQSLSIEMLLWLTEADMRARSENTDFTPLSQDNVPLVGELRTWILDTSNEIKKSGEKNAEIVSGNLILETIKKPHGVWVKAIKELVEDSVFDPEIREFIPRPYIFDNNNKIQKDFIFLLFSNATNLMTSRNITWEDISKDELFRQEIIRNSVVTFQTQKAHN